MISFYAFRKSKQKDTALSSSNTVIYNQTIRTTKNTPNNSSTGIMPHLAKALCLLLLLLSILLVSMASPINVIIAKDCTDEGTSGDGSSPSCNTQDSNSFTHSPSGNDGNGEHIPLKHTKSILIMKVAMKILKTTHHLQCHFHKYCNRNYFVVLFILLYI
jgi:hypothetical protein